MMPIYDRAQGPSQMLRGQATSLLGMGQPAQLPQRPDIPQVGVGDVDFLQGAAEDRSLGMQRQQQTIGNLLQTLQLGIQGYGAYQQGAFGGGGGQARPSYGPQSFSNDPGYMLSYQGYPQRF